MKPRYLIVLLLPVLACNERGAPVSPDEPELRPTSALLAADRPQYLAPRTIVRAGPAPQVSTIDLAELPYSRFMEPFYLYVRENEGPDVRGTISVDGVRVVGLAGVLPGEEVRKRIALGAASRVELSLSGPRDGSITLWIEGKVQPPPVITITSPVRAAMLQTGTFDPAPIAISGEACDANFPITGLTVNGVDVPVAGTQLCEPFNVTQTSAWGMTMIDVSARNARGRSARRVQSYLRGPEYYAPSLSFDDILTFDPTNDVANATLVRFEATGVSKLRAVIPSVLAAASTAIGSSIPNPMANTWRNPLRCSATTTARGYRVDHGTPSSALKELTPVVLSDQHLRFTAYFRVAVPLTVTGYLRSGCNPVQTTTRFGSVYDEDITVHGDMTFGVIPDIGGADVRLATVSINDFNPVTSINLLQAGLTAAQVAEIRALIQTQFASHVQSDLVAAMQTTNTLGDFLESFTLPSDRLRALGLSFTHAARAVYMHHGMIDVGFAAQVVPTTPRAGTAPRRGAIRKALVSPVEATAADVDYYVGDNLLNQMLWAAWQAGHFDAADITQLTGAVPGLNLQITSALPPVMMTTTGSDRMQFGWGDVRFTATIDPAVFGLPPSESAAPIVMRAYGSISLEALVQYDAATHALVLSDANPTAHVQLAATGNRVIDETAVEQQIANVLEAAASRLIASVVAATPLPVADWSGHGGAAPGTPFLLQNTSIIRSHATYHLVTGAIGVN